VLNPNLPVAELYLNFVLVKIDVKVSHYGKSQISRFLINRCSYMNKPIGKPNISMVKESRKPILNKLRLKRSGFLWKLVAAITGISIFANNLIENVHRVMKFSLTPMLSWSNMLINWFWSLYFWYLSPRTQKWGVWHFCTSW